MYLHTRYLVYMYPTTRYLVCMYTSLNHRAWESSPPSPPNASQKHREYFPIVSFGQNRLARSREGEELVAIWDSSCCDNRYQSHSSCDDRRPGFQLSWTNSELGNLGSFSTPTIDVETDVGIDVGTDVGTGAGPPVSSCLFVCQA